MFRGRLRKRLAGQSGQNQAGGAQQQTEPPQDEEWTWDNLPVPQLLAATWAGIVGSGRGVFSAPESPPEGAPIDYAARQVRAEQRAAGGGRRHRLRRAWQRFDPSAHADPATALQIVLVLGVLLWVFPDSTFAALGWIWRHTLGLPFQSSRAAVGPQE